MLAITVVCGVRLKKALLGNILIAKCSFSIWVEVVSNSWFLKYSVVFSTKNINCPWINNHGETLYTLQIFSIKKAMIHEIFGANPPNSPLNPLDWPAYIVLDNFWSPGHCGVSHSCGFWNCGQEKFLADIHCFYASLCRLTATNMRLHLVWSILKVQSYKLYNNKYMIPSTQITNTEIFLFIAVLVFKLLTRKVLFIHRKKQ